MEKWIKYVSRLRRKEQLLLLETVGLIMKNQTAGLAMKKLKGHKNVYRVRIGRYRIIFEAGKTQNFIIKVDEKDDHTYKF